jgi:hypothetical protein
MRSGRYLKSIFNLPGFGVSCWVVGCYVEVDYKKYINDMGEKNFIDECISYLNEPPPRQKFQRTPRKPLYGTLQLYVYKLKESDGKCFIEMELITDDPKNKNFWGEGIRLDHLHKRRSSKNRNISSRQQHRP